MLRSFFYYVPSEPWPEAPASEPPDPNADRALPEPYRASRRSLVALCAVCLAWSAAQFGLSQFKIDAAGLTVDLHNASVPLLLGTALVYLTARWMLEYAMMPRHVRRWPLAQLDFRGVYVVSRFSILAVSAGALDRSVRSVLAITAILASLAVATALLTALMMFITVPIRMRARRRADRPSAARAAMEGLTWALLFAIVLTVSGTVALAVAGYRYTPLRTALGATPPNPIAFSLFVLTLAAVFLSHWLSRPIVSRLFAERPGYTTRRDEDGHLIYTLGQREPKEPLL